MKMKMKMKTVRTITVLDFQIHVSDETRKSSHVNYFMRSDKPDLKKRTEEGLEIKSKRLLLFTMKNPVVKLLSKDIDVSKDLLEGDPEIARDGLAGKSVEETNTLYLDEENELCYNFTEYEIVFDRKGNPVPCDKCGEIYCEHRIKGGDLANVDIEEKPVRWIAPITLSLVEAINKYSFKSSIQLYHRDQLQYEFLYNMAKQLHESEQMVLLATIKDGKPQRLVLRKGGRQYWGFLEGRIRDDGQYALIVHQTEIQMGG